MSHQVMSGHEPPAHPKETSVLLESLIEGTKKGKAFVRIPAGKEAERLEADPAPASLGDLDVGRIASHDSLVRGNGLRHSHDQRLSAGFLVFCVFQGSLQIFMCEPDGLSL